MKCSWFSVVVLAAALAGCRDTTTAVDPPEAARFGRDHDLWRNTQIELVTRQDGTHAFVVSGLSDVYTEALRDAATSPFPWGEIFAVRVVDKANAAVPPMLGEYRVEKDQIIFEPAFPLRPGLEYSVTFDPGGRPVLRGAPNYISATLTWTIPAPPSEPARVTAIYPTRDVLPENQLKFYIHFSAPMSRGEAYQRVRLFDQDGKRVEYPFLELGEELWDPQGRRFTLFFDPGRIKRGLAPREMFGPALIEGKSYTLIVDAGWLDAAGKPIAEEAKKAFRAAAPDDDQPDARRWKISPPPAGTGEPLVVEFDEPLDRAMLERVLVVKTASGESLAGAVAIDGQETRWSFTPELPWRAGKHVLAADASLEDLAGNSLGRPFEVDVFRPIETALKTEVVEIPFEIAAE
jgi:hypothetical protein